MTDFDVFWSHYPLKKGKGAARKKFEQLLKEKRLPSVDELIQAIHDQAKEKKHLKSQNLFCPPWKNPSTWLNQECWKDECILPRARVRQIKNHSIDTLHRAYNILSNLGQEKFKSYCLQVGLSRDDQEAVWNKYQGKFDVQQLAQGMLK